MPWREGRKLYDTAPGLLCLPSDEVARRLRAVALLLGLTSGEAARLVRPGEGGLGAGGGVRGASGGCDAAGQLRGIWEARRGGGGEGVAG